MRSPAILIIHFMTAFIRLLRTIPNHPGDMPEGTLRAILKQSGVEPAEFLKKK